MSHGEDRIRLVGASYRLYHGVGEGVGEGALPLVRLVIEGAYVDIAMHADDAEKIAHAMLRTVEKARKAAAS